MIERLNQFVKAFSENAFWKKITRYARQAGVKTVYTALLLYFAYKRPETPTWAKNIALGALGYLISPLDWLPDLTPIFGYTDDIGVLGFGLIMIAGHVNDGVKEKARQQLQRWFGNFEEADLKEVDERL